QWMHRRTYVVQETGQGKLFGPHSATDARGPFQQQDRQTGLLHGQRGGKAVRPRTDHHHVAIGPVSIYFYGHLYSTDYNLLFKVSPVPSLPRDAKIHSLP